jgi:hypothetical protein
MSQYKKHSTSDIYGFIFLEFTPSKLRNQTSTYIMRVLVGKAPTKSTLLNSYLEENIQNNVPELCIYFWQLHQREL